jgi:hypothetical protein
MSDLQLMQEIVSNVHPDDKWEVYTSGSKDPYILNGKEYLILEDALIKGIKAIIHFNDFALNTAFFVSSERVKKGNSFKESLEKSPGLLETPYDNEMAKKKLKEIREQLGVKLSIQK